MALIIYLTVINLLTFFLYWQDKRRARAYGDRTPEYILLLAGFAGGTPAAFAAQRILRHKNRKQRFQLKFWGLTGVQLWLIIWPPEALHWAFLRVFH